MTKRKSRDREADNLNQALAILISSTHSKKRLLPLTEVARWLNVAVKKLGSYSEVADRIGLSTKMLRQFSCVQRLDGYVQKLIEARKIDSVDAVVHLAMLPAKEQKTLAGALVAGEIDTKDIRAVNQMRRLRQADSIKELLRRVKTSKTKIEYVAEFVVRGSRTRNSMLRAFQEHVSPEEIIRLEIEGAIGRLVLTQKGKQQLFRTAHKLGTPIKHVVPRILQG